MCNKNFFNIKEQRQIKVNFLKKIGWCPEIWDKILCWPSTAPGELAILSCPSYIAGFNTHVINKINLLINYSHFDFLIINIYIYK